MTSHDVVAIVRKKTGVKRVGHGGTLDPLAEGVLVIAVGRENTKLLDKYTKGEKEYLATLKLGQISDTDDADGPIHEYILDNNQGEILSTKPVPTKAEIQKCIKKFIGSISQTPPIYSAIKISGIPAHRRVRRGQKIKLKPREVFIKEIEVISYDYPLLELKVTCGPGAYIRSLARDIGENLKTGAYLTKLVRTKVGKFSLKGCVNIKELS